MKNKPKISKPPKQKIGLTIAVIILLIIILFFSRFGILRYFINRKFHHFNRNAHSELVYNKLHFSGISTVTFSNLALVSKSHPDSLFYIDSLSFRIDLFSLLKGDISLNRLVARNLKMHFIDKDNYNNYSFFFKNNKPSAANQQLSATNYQRIAVRFLNLFFNKCPHYIDISRFSCLIDYGDDSLSLLSDNISLNNKNLNADFRFLQSRQKFMLSVSGMIDDHNDKLTLSFVSSPRSSSGLHDIPVPFTAYKLNTFGFDTLSFAISNDVLKHDVLSLSGSVRTSGFKLNNSSLSPNDIEIERAGIDFDIRLGDNFIVLDSSSVITLGSLRLSPYIKYVNNKDKRIELILNKDNFPAQSLFESLPKGIFNNLQGIKTKGELSYHLSFIADLALPDSLKFSSRLSRHNFSILSLGSSELSKLNSSFLYTAYDKNIPVRTFTVGPENPYFTPLPAISPYLIHSVLTSEDGGFFLHRGFNEDAFRESLIKNIKEKRFARGGSTITMQLVKNVFLNRNKNIGRKLEEALIVWLIENNNLSSKDRMLEVYLNIIEWGPRVYGIGEASEFYFHKKPANLSLAESIYLASIIPHPKWYKYSFDADGNLKEGLQGFYRLVATKMVHKEYISQAEADNLRPIVHLKGKSLQYLTQDTLGKKINIDSLYNSPDF